MVLYCIQLCDKYNMNRIYYIYTQDELGTVLWVLWASYISDMYVQLYPTPVTR